MHEKKLHILFSVSEKGPQLAPYALAQEVAKHVTGDEKEARFRAYKILAASVMTGILPRELKPAADIARRLYEQVKDTQGRPSP